MTTTTTLEGKMKMEEETMEECATCFCGNQSWTIYGDRIECTKCKNEYVFMLDEMVIAINNKRREFLKIMFPPPEPLEDKKK